MITYYRTSFERDIKKITDAKLLDLIAITIENIEKSESINDIVNLKKMSGYKTFYRVKINDYRLGITIDNNIVNVVRFLHRKDIYKLFP